LGSQKVAVALIKQGISKNPMGLLCRLFKLTPLLGLLEAMKGGRNASRQD